MKKKLLFLLLLIDGIYGLFIGIGFQKFSIYITSENKKEALLYFGVLIIAMSCDVIGKIFIPLLKEHYFYNKKIEYSKKCFAYKSFYPDYNLENALSTNLEKFLKFNISIFENLLCNIISLTLTVSYFIYIGKYYYAAFSLALVLFTYLISSVYNKKLIKYGNTDYEEFNKINDFYSSVSKNANDLVNNKSMELVLNKQSTLQKQFFTANIKDHVLSNNLKVFNKDFIPNFLILVVFLFVILLKSESDSITDVIAYLYLYHRFINPSNNILDFIRNYFSNKKLIKEFQNVNKNYKIHKKDYKNRITSEINKKDFNIKNIQIKLNNEIKNINPVNFSTPGVYKICGQNGKGKSQFLKACKGNYGYMPQVPFVYNISIEQNIKLDISESIEEFNFNSSFDLLKILKKESFNEIVKNEELSLGQRQMISFSRLIYKNEYVNIMDEPECGLDMENLNIIKNYIQENKKNKVFIIVSHSDVFEDLTDKEININEIIR